MNVEATYNALLRLVVVSGGIVDGHKKISVRKIANRIANLMFNFLLVTQDYKCQLMSDIMHHGQLQELAPKLDLVIFKLPNTLI
jgi:hypothetical protein